MAKLETHVVASVVAGGGIYAVTGSLPAATACAATGILVDLDHFPDYWFSHGFSLRIKHFMESCYEGRLQRFFLLMHSIELLFVLGCLVWRTGFNTLLFGVFMGYGLHLLLDQVMNLHKPFAYFILYRLARKFVPGVFKP